MKKFYILTVITLFFMNICCSQHSIASEQHYIKQRNSIIKSNNYHVSFKLTPEEKLFDKKLYIMKHTLIKSYKGTFPYNFPILNDKRLTESALYRFAKNFLRVQIYMFMGLNLCLRRNILIL